MLSDDLLTNIIYPTIVLLGTSFMIFICSLFYKMLKKRKKENKLEETNKYQLLSEPPQVSILIELKEPKKIYRATKADNSYLPLYVMLVNTSNEIIVIRNIEALMSNMIGIFQQERISVPATHEGMSATYVMSSTKSLFPLSITGNTSIDAYILFVFPNSKIELGSIQLKLNSSKGEIIIPLSVDVIG